MTEEEAIGTLSTIISPITGRFLGNQAAELLYHQLKNADPRIDDVIQAFSEKEMIDDIKNTTKKN